MTGSSGLVSPVLLIIKRTGLNILGIKTKVRPMKMPLNWMWRHAQPHKTYAWINEEAGDREAWRTMGPRTCLKTEKVMVIDDGGEGFLAVTRLLLIIRVLRWSVYSNDAKQMRWSVWSVVCGRQKSFYGSEKFLLEVVIKSPNNNCTTIVISGVRRSNSSHLIVWTLKSEALSSCYCRLYVRLRCFVDLPYVFDVRVDRRA